MRRGDKGTEREMENGERKKGERRGNIEKKPKREAEEYRQDGEMGKKIEQEIGRYDEE